MSIGQASAAYGNTGIYLGTRNVSGTNTPSFSLVNHDSSRYLKWTGSDLEINGSIGGEIGSILIGSTSNGILIDQNGIEAKKSNSTTFKLDSTGDAVFAGELKSNSGEIGGWKIDPSGFHTGTPSPYTNAPFMVLKTTDFRIGEQRTFRYPDAPSNYAR